MLVDVQKEAVVEEVDGQIIYDGTKAGFSGIAVNN
jgi:hypothetical protein